MQSAHNELHGHHPRCGDQLEGVPARRWQALQLRKVHFPVSTDYGIAESDAEGCVTPAQDRNSSLHCGIRLQCGFTVTMHSSDEKDFRWPSPVDAYSNQTAMNTGMVFLVRGWLEKRMTDFGETNLNWYSANSS
ncbi:hypothetical protein BV898_11497 [Hypsibius exemplaris]|uniref:Uncharacterized protein n=1 Tax=Hypsibius exemplaris TaxID=2072580 RepID=A0A1W0WGD6_HYPEX|nr:hypothetical protein BV898_11497 [Hypsibius exemplaris]